MGSRSFSVTPGSTVRLRTRFLSGGVLTDPHNFPSDVGIYTVASGGIPVSTLSPVKESTGIYRVDYVLPITFSAPALYDEWSWTSEPGLSPNVQRYLSDTTVSIGPPGSQPIQSPADAVGHILKTVAPATTTVPPKSGFIAKAVPKSVIESVSVQSHDRLKTIAKSAMEHYLRSFLDTGGQNRSAIEAVSKGSLQFITDRSIEATHDQTKRATQLARLYNEIREHLPSILIVDAGMEFVPSGLMSGLSHATLLDGKWQGWINKQFKIPLTISVLTGDQDSTDQLMEIVLLALTSLRQISGGSAIRSDKPGDHWEVRIPLVLSISATTGANITEDTKDQVWYANFDITVEAEDTFEIEMPLNARIDPDEISWMISQNIYIDEPNLSSKLPPEILAPGSIQINSPTSVAIRRLRPFHKVVVDQPMIATFDPMAQVVTPRKLGTFTLMVVDLQDRQDDQGPRALAPVVVASKIISVIL